MASPSPSRENPNYAPNKGTSQAPPQWCAQRSAYQRENIRSLQFAIGRQFRAALGLRPHLEMSWTFLFQKRKENALGNIPKVQERCPTSHLLPWSAHFHLEALVRVAYIRQVSFGSVTDTLPLFSQFPLDNGDKSIIPTAN